MNRAAFAENGYSKGVFYNMYCNARVTLSDGRVYVFGGHDMQSDNGLYKVNIFDPETETWVKRSEACNPRELAQGSVRPGVVRPRPERAVLRTTAIRETSRAPSPGPSDQKYARW